MVCVSKAELTGADEVRDDLAADLGRDVLLISAVTGEGLATFVGDVVRHISDAKREEALAAKPVTEFATEKSVCTGDGLTGHLGSDIMDS